MFARLAHAVSEHWLLMLFAWLLIALAVHSAAPSWDSLVADGEAAYLPSSMSSVRGATLLAEAFPDIHSLSEVVLVVARPGGALTRADYALADRLVQQLTSTPDAASPVTFVLSHATPLLGSGLVSRLGHSGQATLIVVSLRTEMAAVANMDFIRELRQTLAATRREADCPAGLELGLTGAAAINADTLLAAEKSIHNTELTTIALVVLILLAVYRAPGLVLVPLVVILATWVLSIDLLALLAALSERVAWFDFKIFRTSKIFIIVILFGAATDYCLFLISRYLEGLRQRLPAGEALQTAVARLRGRHGQRAGHGAGVKHDGVCGVRPLPLWRAEHRLDAGGCPAGVPDLGPRLAAGRGQGRLLALPRRQRAGVRNAWRRRHRAALAGHRTTDRHAARTGLPGQPARDGLASVHRPVGAAHV